MTDASVGCRIARHSLLVTFVEVGVGRPYGLLRAGFPYVKTIGMRRVTNFPLDLAIGKDETLYVLCRSAGSAQIARVTFDDDNLGPISGYGTDDGKFQLPSAIILDRDENLFVSV